jgi:hypothetical protein
VPRRRLAEPDQASASDNGKQLLEAIDGEIRPCERKTKRIRLQEGMRPIIECYDADGSTFVDEQIGATREPKVTHEQRGPDVAVDLRSKVIRIDREIFINGIEPNRESSSHNRIDNGRAMEGRHEHNAPLTRQGAYSTVNCVSGAEGEVNLFGFYQIS